MAFVRMGQGSDVYVYDHRDEGLTCGLCGGLSTGRVHYGLDVDGLLGHLDEHRSLGHRVPDHLKEELRRHEAGDPDVG